MKSIAEGVLLVVAIVGVAGGIWNRSEQGKAIGVRFIQYLGLVVLVPVLAILSLEGKISVEITGAIAATAVGGVLGSLRKDDLRLKKANADLSKPNNEKANETIDSRNQFAWKKRFMMLAAIGGGFAVFIAVIFGGWIWFQGSQHNEQPWNNKAIRATFKELTIDESTPKFRYTFSYILENTTDFDYTIDSNSQFLVMAKLPNGEGNETDPALSVELPIFIPAKEKVVVKVFKDCNYDNTYKEQDRDNMDKLTDYTHRMLKNLDGFVFIDKIRRYKIVLPNVPPVKTKDAEKPK